MIAGVRPLWYFTGAAWLAWPFSRQPLELQQAILGALDQGQAVAAKSGQDDPLRTFAGALAAVGDSPALLGLAQLLAQQTRPN